jgi:cyclomaltodextrinase
VSWVDHVIWWQVYPLGFLGAEKELGPFQSEVNRLPRLQAWLDHLISWGGNGLLLGPIFSSSSHGYDTIDYFQIDPRLGDDGDFDALVAACRERGVRLLLDGVFNHAGRDFAPVAQALAEGPGSGAEDWVSQLYDTGGVITADYFEGHGNLVTLNHSSARVQQYVREVMLHWLRRGIDGWRLDAAYAVPARFWAAVLPAVREEFPDAWFVGEMIHGDYIDYVQTSGLDSVTEYELWWAIWSSINNINFHELEWTLGRHAKFVEHFRPLTFLSNHDVTRVASQIGLPRRRVRPEGSQREPPKWRRRRTAGDAERAVAVHAFAPRSGAGISADDRAAPPQPLAGRRDDRDRTGGQGPSRRPGPGPARRAGPGPGPQPGR